MNKKNFLLMQYFCFGIFLSVLLASCGSGKLMTVQANYCEPPSYATVSETPIGFDSDSLLVASSVLSEALSVQNVVLAHALGLSDVLRESIVLQADTGSTA